MPKQLSDLCAIDYGALKQVITWALIIFGWVVVHILSSQREKNKDKRVLIESIRLSVLDIEKLGIEYHTFKTESFDQYEEDITSLLDMIGSRINHVENEFVDEEMMEFRKSITLNNFQGSSDTRTKYMPNSVFIMNIRTASKILCDKLETKFYSLY